MKVFVTGASGYIGFAVACAFRRAGHSVMGFVRSKQSALLLQAHEIAPVVGDIGEPKSYIHAATEADALIHCASDHSPDRVAKDALAIETLIAAAQHGKGTKTLIYTSGCWIYGNTHGKTVDESTPVTPLSIVTWRPGHEEMVRRAESERLRCVILRPGCVYGGAGGIIPAQWFASAADGEVIVCGSGDNHLTMVHLDDVATAYLLAVEKKIGGATLNVNDGSLFTVKQMATAVAEAAGVPSRLKFLSHDEVVKRFGSHAIGPMTDQKISSEKIGEMLHWKALQPNFIAAAGRCFSSWQANRAMLSTRSQ